MYSPGDLKLTGELSEVELVTLVHLLNKKGVDSIFTN
jgi:hypothetical protein